MLITLKLSYIYCLTKETLQMFDYNLSISNMNLKFRFRTIASDVKLMYFAFHKNPFIS